MALFGPRHTERRRLHEHWLLLLLLLLLVLLLLVLLLLILLSMLLSHWLLVNRLHRLHLSELLGGHFKRQPTEPVTA